MRRSVLRRLWEFLCVRHAEISALCEVITVCALVTAGIWAYSTFHNERAQFRVGILVQAYQAFYENPRHRVVRHSLDNDSELSRRLERLVAMTPVARKPPWRSSGTSNAMEGDDAGRIGGVSKDRGATPHDDAEQQTPTDDEVVEWFNDYLNFFEFISWLNKTGQLDDASVNGMFDYYITCLGRHAWICEYLNEPANGYEYLRGVVSQKKLTIHHGLPTMKLFVYGTLRKDCCPDISQHFLQNATFVGHGTVGGILLDLGSYPGLAIDDNRPQRVRGEVWSLRPGSADLDKLDHYEGCGITDEKPHEFSRLVLAVTMEDGAEMPCWVYVFKGDPKEARVIDSGDYKDHLER